ncbi:hypothetical protein Lser_V15G04962 [Lactuca serriola]
MSPLMPSIAANTHLSCSVFVLCVSLFMVFVVFPSCVPGTLSACIREPPKRVATTSYPNTNPQTYLHPNPFPVEACCVQAVCVCYLLCTCFDS